MWLLQLGVYTPRHLVHAVMLYTTVFSTWNHEFATRSETGFVIFGPDSVYKHSSMYQNF